MPFESLHYDDRPVRLRCCDSPGCPSPADYRAPRDRELSGYYWFCLTHVREYNKNWDFFAGMSSADIEAHIRKATVWDRPTWPMGDWQARESNLRDHVMHEFFADTAETTTAPPMPKAERDAYLVLELTPPVTFVEIKAQYRMLVKRHHPDANDGSHQAEEKFKTINQAFTALKQIYSAEDADPHAP